MDSWGSSIVTLLSKSFYKCLRGWVIALTRSNDEEFDTVQMSKLIRKVWMNPMKAVRFYKYLKKRDITSNIIITLQACLSIQYYFLYGPYEVHQPYKHSEVPIAILSLINTTWSQILKKHSKVFFIKEK